MCTSFKGSKPIFLAMFAMWASIPTPGLSGQGTLADYQRGHELQAKAKGLVVNTPGPTNWIGETDHFWYTRAVKGGTEFVLVDADAGTKKAAFDQERLAGAISKATNHPYTALMLPFAPMTGRGGAARPMPGAAMSAPLTFVDGEKAIQFGVSGSLYKCGLADYLCAKTGPVPEEDGRGGRGASPEDEALISPEGPGAILWMGWSISRQLRRPTMLGTTIGYSMLVRRFRRVVRDVGAGKCVVALVGRGWVWARSSLGSCRQRLRRRVLRSMGSGWLTLKTSMCS